MSKVSYPAIFHEEDNSYWVEFPDLNGCVSQGNSFEEAYENACEALGVYLDKDGDLYEREINKPSKVKDVIKKNKKANVMLVEYDSLEYAKKYKKTAVKKTLTIPEWLNDAACKENINFSAVLQKALLAELKIK